MQLAGKRVLLVEDEPLLLLDLQDMVVRMGCQVVASRGDLSAALNQARDAEVDLAVLDVNLGGERIDPVADVLAERGIPFVFASGYADAGIPGQHAHRPLVQKPYQGEKLHAALMRCAEAGGLLP
jgi:CheY-like chemotaxis protein